MADPDAIVVNSGPNGLAARGARLARRRPSHRAIAAALAGLVLATLIGTIVVPAGRPTSLAGLLAGLGLVLMIAITAVVGLLVAWHQPGNRIGWLLLVAALLYPVGLNAADYSLFYSSLGGWGHPAGQLAFLLEPLWISPIVIFPFIILLFPDGRLPSPRWRWLVWAGGAAALAVVGVGDIETIGAMVTHRFRLTPGGTLAAQPWMPSWVNIAVPLLVLVILGGLWLAAIGWQVASWRRSSGERRQQLKWLMSGGVVFGVAVVPSLAATSALWEVAALGFAAIPGSIGVAVLKYRLYDIDRIISRTLAYALVTGVLVGVYAGLVLLATEVLRFSSPVAVAAATLAAAALFSPLRRRVQRGVDRRFNRARYDADQLVAAFAARLSEAVSLSEVRAGLESVTHAALEPAHISVWVAGGES
jgi:MFS family permease